jgi:hypothetical protein
MGFKFRLLSKIKIFGSGSILIASGSILLASGSILLASGSGQDARTTLLL